MGRSPCCEKVGLNRGAWTREEDEKLMEYITTHGEGSWRTLPKAAGLLRCGKSCRLRWINYLRPDLKRGNITEEEDVLIMKLHSVLGNRWSQIAARLPGRTDNEIKNYWNTHMKKKLQDMGIDPNTHNPLIPHNHKMQQQHLMAMDKIPAAAVTTIASNHYSDPSAEALMRRRCTADQPEPAKVAELPAATAAAAAEHRRRRVAAMARGVGLGKVGRSKSTKDSKAATTTFTTGEVRRRRRPIAAEAQIVGRRRSHSSSNNINDDKKKSKKNEVVTPIGGSSSCSWAMADINNNGGGAVGRCSSRRRYTATPNVDQDMVHYNNRSRSPSYNNNNNTQKMETLPYFSGGYGAVSNFGGGTAVPLPFFSTGPPLSTSFLFLDIPDPSASLRRPSSLIAMPYPTSDPVHHHLIRPQQQRLSSATALTSSDQRSSLVNVTSIPSTVSCGSMQQQQPLNVSFSSATGTCISTPSINHPQRNCNTIYGLLRSASPSYAKPHGSHDYQPHHHNDTLSPPILVNNGHNSAGVETTPYQSSNAMITSSGGVMETMVEGAVNGHGDAQHYASAAAGSSTEAGRTAANRDVQEERQAKAGAQSNNEVIGLTLMQQEEEDGDPDMSMNRGAAMGEASGSGGGAAGESSGGEPNVLCLLESDLMWDFDMALHHPAAAAPISEDDAQDHVLQYTLWGGGYHI